MSKSNYPNKLDTSVEIPVVRDNITEIGSDVLNGLRSAIFNIERALGINPHGSAGGTVASRVSRSLDDSGNIKKDALDRANVLSGPISDSDVSKVAAINESKLNLNFPTQLLQDEISILNSQIDDIIRKIEELNIEVATHVHPDATNRHNATAITVSSYAGNPSDISTSSLDLNNLQDTLSSLYDGHINYTGLGISETNNSHSADQIHYDNDDTKGVLTDDDVQSAITSLSLLGSATIRDFVLNLSSNGIVRTGAVKNDYLDSSFGEVLVDETTITYFTGFDSTTVIMLPEHPLPSKSISEFDVLTISNAVNDDDNGNYRVKNVILNPSSEVTNIEIYGILRSESASGTLGRVTKNTYSAYNENGFNCAVRPRVDKTNTPDIQVANPNSATIISSGISPQSITPDNHVFSISIDSGDPIDIETYDDTPGQQQSLSTIVHKINTQLAEMHLDCLAYRVRVGTCYELAISHNVPNFNGDIKDRTLMITAPDLLDGLEILGLLGHSDVLYFGESSNAYHINGYIHTDFGRIQALDSDQLTLTIGTTRISFSSAEEAAEHNVRRGDLVVISGSSEPSDDGTYRIGDISSEAIYIDDDSVAFSGALVADTSVVYIIRCTIPVGELTFSEAVLPDGSIMFDGFVDEEKNVFFKKRMEVDGDIVASGFVLGVIDVSRNFIKKDQVATLSVTNSHLSDPLAAPDSILRLEDPLGVVGEGVYVGSSGEYKVYSSDGLSYIVVQVHMTNPPPVDMEVNLHGFDEVPDGALWLCRGIFSNSLGYVIGHVDGDMWVPSILDKRATGTVDNTIISENILERYIQGPRNELRGTGVIRGLKVSNHFTATDAFGDYHIVDISAGVAVVNGIRIEFVGANEFRVNLDHTDDFYISIDPYGCIRAGKEDASLAHSYPFIHTELAVLAHIDASESYATDLRLFVDHLDYKYLGDVTVSNDQRFGHFTSVRKALEYAKMFSKIFPETGIPSILVKEGVYLIEETIYIDFDVAIRGVGSGTIFKRSGDLLGSAGLEPYMNAIFSIGSIPESPYVETSYGSSTDIISGVTLENFAYKAAPDPDWHLSGRYAVISLQQEIDVSPTSCFRFSNIEFQGDESVYGLQTGNEIIHTGSAALPYEIALYVGREDLARDFGNIIFTNNFINSMGFGNGAVYFDESNNYSNVIITNNIAINVHQYNAVNSVNSDGITPGLYGVVSSYSILNCTFDRFIEANNTSDDQ